MASTVINNSSSIHDYRGQIAHAIDELQLQLKKTEQAIATVSESWKDDNFREFQNNFEEDKGKISPLCNVLTVYQEDKLYQLEKKLE